MRVSCLLRKDIMLMLKQCKRIYTSSFIAYIQKSLSYKLTISINKSYGNACKRNLHKRRIYNLLHNKYKNVYIFIRATVIHNNKTFLNIQNDVNILDNYIKRLNVVI